MENKKLQREISLTGALSTVMGTVIGAGVFFKAAAVASHTQSAGLALFAWLLAGVLAICGGLTVAELATAIPKTGGAIQYIEATYGKVMAFLLGWAQTIIYYPANIAALSIIFATQLMNLFHLSQQALIPVAIITAISVTGINLLGTRVAARVQSITLIIKLLPIFAIVIYGLLTPGAVNVSLINLEIGGDQSWVAGFSGALLATSFAYDGWLNVGNVAGELKNPERDLPKAIILGLSFVTLIYWAINFVFFKLLPVDQIAGNLNAASEAAGLLFGTIGGKLVTIGILISVYGALNGYTMTGIRVPYALALQTKFRFSSSLTKLTRRTYVPLLPALIQLVIGCGMILVGSFDLLTDMLIFVMWFFSVLIFFAVFILRKKEPTLARPYKVPLYPITPIIAIVGGLFILIMTAMTQPILVLSGVSLTLLGIPVYYLGQKKA